MVSRLEPARRNEARARRGARRPVRARRLHAAKEQALVTANKVLGELRATLGSAAEANAYTRSPSEKRSRSQAAPVTASEPPAAAPPPV